MLEDLNLSKKEVEARQNLEVNCALDSTNTSIKIASNIAQNMESALPVWKVTHGS